MSHRAPIFRVVELCPVFGERVDVTLCDTAGDLARCEATAARFTREARRESSWAPTYRVARQDAAMRAVRDGSGFTFPAGAVPLTFI